MRVNPVFGFVSRPSFFLNPNVSISRQGCMKAFIGAICLNTLLKNNVQSIPTDFSERFFKMQADKTIPYWYEKSPSRICGLDLIAHIVGMLPKASVRDPPPCCIRQKRELYDYRLWIFDYCAYGRRNTLRRLLDSLVYQTDFYPGIHRMLFLESQANVFLICIFRTSRLDWQYSNIGISLHPRSS